MNQTRTEFDAAAVRRYAEKNLHSGLDAIVHEVQHAAETSMKPQTKRIIPTKTGKPRVKYGHTPPGKPPRTREGLIQKNIKVAFVDPLHAIIGPAQLPGHKPDTLANLEYGKHPFMTPALNAVSGHANSTLANVFGG